MEYIAGSTNKETLQVMEFSGRHSQYQYKQYHDAVRPQLHQGCDKCEADFSQLPDKETKFAPISCLPDTQLHVPQTYASAPAHTQFACQSPNLTVSESSCSPHRHPCSCTLHSQTSCISHCWLHLEVHNAVTLTTINICISHSQRRQCNCISDGHTGTSPQLHPTLVWKYSHRLCLTSHSHPWRSCISYSHTQICCISHRLTQTICIHWPS